MVTYQLLLNALHFTYSVPQVSLWLLLLKVKASESLKIDFVRIRNSHWNRPVAAF